MQPPLLIDWLKQLHLTADAALAGKRWKLAKSYADRAGRTDAILLLRLFLFPEPPASHVEALTRQFLEFDSEFPASNNAEEVRLMAGIVMIAAIQGDSYLSDVFGLGIKAAAFPTHRCSPAQRGIIDELAKNLDAKSNKLRPSDFDNAKDSDAISSKLAEFGGVVAGNDEAATKKCGAEVAELFRERYGHRLQRLSEETAILWWLLGAYSSELNQETAELSADSYSLVAAAEVAERTQLLPPPPSIYAILTRALAQCKGSKKKKPTLKDAIEASDAKWRSRFVSTHQATDCGDLVPLVTAMSKVEDAADISALPKALQKACPGVAADLTLPPIQAARQMYNEIIFLKALSKLS